MIYQRKISRPLICGSPTSRASWQRGENYFSKNVVAALLKRIEIMKEEMAGLNQTLSADACPACGTPVGDDWVMDIDFNRLAELIAECATDDALDYIYRNAADYLAHTPLTFKQIVANRSAQLPI